MAGMYGMANSTDDFNKVFAGDSENGMGAGKKAQEDWIGGYRIPEQKTQPSASAKAWMGPHYGVDLRSFNQGDNYVCRPDAPLPYVATGTIGPAQSGLDNIKGAFKAYFNRDDVSAGEALNAAWKGGGNDLVAGVGHSLGAGMASTGAVFSSPSVVGSLGLGALALQQTDAAVADYRRFFGSGDERGAQSLLTQGMTPVIGSQNAAYANAGIDFVTGVGFPTKAMPSAWTVKPIDIAAGMRHEAAQAAIQTTPALRTIAQTNGGKMLGLQHVVKAPDSLMRKIVKYPGQPINDALRYTMSFNEAGFTSGVKNAMNSLREQGYKITELRNTFKPGKPYKGIMTLPLFSALHRLPFMRTSCLAAGPRSSVAQTSWD